MVCWVTERALVVVGVLSELASVDRVDGDAAVVGTLEVCLLVDTDV